MFTWAPYPFLRISTAFIIGILIYPYCPLSGSKISLLIPLTAFCFILALGVQYFHPKHGRLVCGHLCLIVVALLGILRTGTSDKVQYNNHLVHEKGSIQGYTGILMSTTIKGDHLRFVVNISHIINKDKMVPKTGWVKIYARVDTTKSSISTYNLGSTVAVRGAPFRIQGARNPNEFDYAAYMAGQGIHFQHFVDLDSIHVIAQNDPGMLVRMTQFLRQILMGKLTETIEQPRERAIANALLLGQKDDLNSEVKRAYSSAGAMHVLAVSGLHMGIIYMVVTFFLRPLRRHTYGKLLFVLVTIAVLWIYAVITGLSPSVLRAATMFSIVVIGQAMSNPPNIYNSLALSALLLLMYEPQLLYAVGFQLSYAAVTGIIYLTPKIIGIWQPNGWLMAKTWELSAVSIAAQISTLPLTIHYFHQFPTYFLISNFMVIPGAFAVMILGLLFLSLSFTPIGGVPGDALEFVLYYLNEGVHLIEQLDHSTVEHLFLDGFETIIAYLFILTLLIFFHYKRMGLVFIPCAVLLIGASYTTWQITKQSTKSELVLYYIRGQSFVDNIRGLSAELLDGWTKGDVKNIDFHIQPNRLAKRLNPIGSSKPDTYDATHTLHPFKLYVWNKKKFLFISKPLNDVSISGAPISTDYLIIRNNAVEHPGMLNKSFECKVIIVDSSNSQRTMQRFKRYATKHENWSRLVCQEKAIIISP